MSFKTRLLKVLDQYRTTPTKLSRKLGYTSGEKISRLLRKEGSYPSYTIINDILNAFPEINARWLITGEGDNMLNSPKDSYGFCAECVKKEAIVKYQEKQMADKDRKIEKLIQQCTELRGKLDQATEGKAS